MEGQEESRNSREEKKADLAHTLDIRVKKRELARGIFFAQIVGSTKNIAQANYLAELLRQLIIIEGFLLLAKNCQIAGSPRGSNLSCFHSQSRKL